MITISSMGRGSSAADYLTKKSEDYYSYDEIMPYTQFYDPNGLFGDELHNKNIIPEQFKNLCAGRHPNSAISLTRSIGDQHKAGTDITFSVPKPVSVIHALCGEKTRELVDEIHVKAVKRSLDFLTDKAGFTRYKVNNKVYHEKTNLLFGLFPHHESRSGDMQEHIHVAVLNICKNSSGNYSAIDSRPLFIWRGAAGARYNVDLAHGLMQQAGIKCERDGRNFTCPVVPGELNDYFSQRRRTIECVAKELKDHLKSKQHGITTQMSDLAENVLRQVPFLTPKQCDISDISNRHIATVISKITRDKKVDCTHAQYLSLWEERANASGVDLSFIDQVASRSLIRNTDPTVLSKIKAEIIRDTLVSLTEQKTVFSEPVLHEKIAEKSIGLLSIDEVDEIYNQLNSFGDIVPIKKQANGLQLFTTVDQIKLELGIKNYLSEHETDFSHQIGIKELAEDIRVFEAEQRKKTPSFKLSEEQKTAIVNVANVCGGVAAYEGIAGAGKSTIARVLANTYQRQGYKVMGYAFSKDAARVLEKRARLKNLWVPNRREW